MNKESNFSLKQAKNVVAARSFEDRSIVINTEQEEFHILNPTASLIWRLVGEGTNFDRLTQAYQNEFDLDLETAKEDCRNLVFQMADKGLLSTPQSDGQTQAEQKSLFGEIREEAVKKTKPLIAHFDLTYQCNLDCSHCYIVKEDRKEVTTDQAKRIIKELADAGVIYLTLSGGEVFTRDDFMEIAEFAQNQAFALRILTNGTLLGRKQADRIADLNPELVALSVYSMEDEVHDRITRHEGSLQKTIRAAEMLASRGVNLKISHIIMEENFGDYKEVHEFAQDLDALFQAEYRLSPKTDGGRSPLDHHVREDNLKEILSDPVFQNESTTDLEEPEYSYSGVFDEIPCAAGHMSCYIDPYGDLQPCVQLPINCGNLLEDSFLELWEESEELLDFRNLRISDLEGCSECEFFGYCRICVGLNYVEEGSLTEPCHRTCKEARIMKQLNQRRR